MSFHLPVGATTEELRSERGKLRKALAEALRLSIAVAAPPSPAAANEWQPAGPTSPALWFDEGNALTINEDGYAGSKSIHPGPYAYVRILPHAWRTPADFGQTQHHLRILGDTRGFSRGVIKGGHLTYSGSLRSAENGPLTNFVMQFRTTGEVWGVTPFVTSGVRGGSFYADAFVANAYEFIEANIAYRLSQGASGPYEVRMGFADMSSMRWTSATGWGGHPVALEHDAEAAMTLNTNLEEDLLAALDTGWGGIAEAFGLPAPSREILVRQIRGR